MRYVVYEQYEVYGRGRVFEEVWGFDSMDEAWYGLCLLYGWGLKGCIRDGLGNEWAISQCPEDVHARYDAEIS